MEYWCPQSEHIMPRGTHSRCVKIGEYLGNSGGCGKAVTDKNGSYVTKKSTTTVSIKSNQAGTTVKTSHNDTDDNDVVFDRTTESTTIKTSTT